MLYWLVTMNRLSHGTTTSHQLSHKHQARTHAHPHQNTHLWAAAWGPPWVFLEEGEGGACPPAAQT